MELEKVLVIDPVTNVEETYKTKEVVYKSNVNTSLYRYTADSQSDTNVIFNNITPPSLNTIINRCLKLKYTLYVRVTGLATPAQSQLYPNGVLTTGAPIQAPNGSTLGFSLILADSPLQVSSTAIELRINGSSTSISPNDYVQLYSHIASNDDLSMFSTAYPHQKDNRIGYVAGSAGALTAGNFRSPFVSFDSNTNIQSRASSIWKLVNSALTDNTAVYSVDVMEDLYLSPMVWGELANKCAGLSNINNLTLNIRISDLRRAVRCITSSLNTFAYDASTTNIEVSFTQFGGTATTGKNAELELQYITPDPVLSAKMPSVLAMDYDYIQSFITNTTQQTFDNIVLQSVRLPSIPKRLYVYAKPSKAFIQQTPYINTVADMFLSITNLKITFNNRINLLANDIPQTLYNKSIANGLKDSFFEWQYGCGSIMIIDVAKDLGLDADECAGQANKYSTLQITASFSNQNVAYQGGNYQLSALSIPANYDYYILVESPGKAFVTPSDCQFVLTGPSSAEVLALTSTMDKVVDHSDLDGKQVGGGAFGIGKLFKSGLNLVKNVNPEHVAQGVKAVQGALGSLGMGVAGGAMKHKRVY